MKIEHIFYFRLIDVRKPQVLNDLVELQTPDIILCSLPYGLYGFNRPLHVILRTAKKNGVL